jgi:uncharacterized caspase-like protein
MRWRVVRMKTIINYLLKNLLLSTVIVFTVWMNGTCAQEDVKSNLPACKGTDVSDWHNCLGTAIDYERYKYVGEWRDGKPNGQGMRTWPNGNNKYIGEFKNGMYNGQGTFIWGAHAKYVGEWRSGSANGHGTRTLANGDQYVGEWRDGRRNGQGTETLANGDRYVGEWRDDNRNGQGTETLAKGDRYAGEWRDHKYNGHGILIKADGRRFEGIFNYGTFNHEAKVNLTNTNNSSQAANTVRSNLELEREQLAQERKNLQEEKRVRGQASNNHRINLQTTNTQANTEGDFVINIQTGTDTASLKINGEEFGGRADGKYIIRKVARAGQETKFTIVAQDSNGNIDTKTITVTRQIAASSAVKYAELNPEQVKKQPERDAVAIIIGIADYKNLPRADYANDDARVFYDYAIRALGVKPENIKLLVDTDADDVAIYRAFKTWLPSRVKSSTDVYVYYSGHGLPTADGQGLYLLPQRADRDFIDKTAITQAEINAAIQAAKPRSVTIFLDACYSGQARSGETLIASARPVTLKAEKQLFPDNFTVITASQADQISSSSPDLKHGIFSYYLMRGMEGDADANRDGKITAGEMQTYLLEQVTRQAGMQNRVQQPQLIGDVNRVLVGR